MRLRHPSRATLREWLAGTVSDARLDARLDAHLAGCERCAASLERLGEGDAPATDRLRTALQTSLAPPADLPLRLTTRVHERQSEAGWRDLVVDAVGGGFDTLRLLMSGEDTDG